MLAYVYVCVCFAEHVALLFYQSIPTHTSVYIWSTSVEQRSTTTAQQARNQPRDCVFALMNDVRRRCRLCRRHETHEVGRPDGWSAGWLVGCLGGVC